MNKKLLYVCLMSLLLLSPSGLMAETESDVPDADAVYELTEVVVTATRYEENVQDIPANVTIISPMDIANSTARDVADLLRTEAGVHVSDITGNRRTYAVDLRGFGETAALNTLVLVDGRRSNQADLSGTDWAQISMDRVARIEIIRGGRASVLYGDNAAGGVVNIITKRGNDMEARAEVNIGSYDTIEAIAQVSGSHGKLAFALTGSYRDSDGYRDNAQSEAEDYGINLGYDFNQRASVDLSFGYHDDKTGLPGTIKASQFAAGVSRTDSVNPDDFADVEDYYFKCTPTIHFFTDSLARVDLSYRERSSTSYATFAGGWFNGETQIDTVTVSPRIILREKLLGRDNKLIVGYDFNNSEEDITNSSEFFGFFSQGLFNMEKENYGYYIHEEMHLLPVLSVSAGYRYDHAEYNFASSFGAVNPSRTKLDEEVFTTGANYKLNSQSNIYISYSRSYRYPVLDEIFNFFMNSIDSNLMPQTSTDWEIGVRYALTDDLMVRLNLFQIETEDEIYYNPDWFSNLNLDGDTCRRGVEFSITHLFGWGRISADYTYTDSEIDNGSFDGNQVPNVPEHLAGFQILVEQFQPFTLAVNSRYVSERPFIGDWSKDFGDQDDYTVVNAKLKYRWRKVEAFLDINNIFNEEYSEYGALGGFPTEEAFFPSSKTNFLVGISISI